MLWGGLVGEMFAMPPWCIVLVCSWRRRLADRHSLPFPWTLSLMGGGAHRPLTTLCPSSSSLPNLSLSTSLSEPPDFPCFTALCGVHTEEGGGGEGGRGATVSPSQGVVPGAYCPFVSRVHLCVFCVYRAPAHGTACLRLALAAACAFRALLDAMEALGHAASLHLNFFWGNGVA